MTTSLETAARRRDILEHYGSFWPNRPIELFTWELGPIRETLPDFRVARVAPPQPDQSWIYASVGAAEVPSTERFEFVIMSPRESPANVETLAMVANYHADPKLRLYEGRILDLGRPWMDGATCDHLLVTLPYPFGPKLEVITRRGDPIRVLWLLPITAQEARYAVASGVEALEQRFDAAEVNVVDTARGSVI